MNYYLFPFEKIRKGSRIILYAAGIVGMDYYRQIRDAGQYDIVMWVDRNANGVTVLEPCSIRKLQDDEYDLVIIAVSSKDVAEQIKGTLREYGVPENKMFFQQPVLKCSVLSSFKMKDFLTCPKCVRDALNEYFRESEGSIEYFRLLIQEIKSEIEKDDGFRERIQEAALGIFENTKLLPEAVIVLLRVLFEAGCFTQWMARLLVNQIGLIKENPAQKHWLLTDLSYIWFLYPHILYNEFFAEKKHLMCDFAKEMNVSWKPPVYVKGDNRDICIIMRSLIINVILQVVSPIISELDNRGYRMHVLNLESITWDTGANFLKPFYFIKSLDSSSRNSIKCRFADSVKLYYPSAPMMIERQQEVLDIICEINPYCILDVSDECSAVSYYYSQDYPTIYFPMRKSEHRSSSFFHKYVFWHMDETIKLPEHLIENQVLRLPILRERIEPLRTFCRDEYGLDDSDIIVITVGNRLPFDVSDYLAGQMCDLLRSDKRLKWMLVGCFELAYIRNNHTDLIGNSIIFVDYEYDLPGLYGICDVYLNPNRIGGGSTIAWAMQQGVAIASSLESSGVNSIGEAFLVKTESELVPYIKSMVDDPTKLLSNKNAMKNTASKWDTDVFIDKLIDGMDGLVEELYGNSIQ